MKEKQMRKMYRIYDNPSNYISYDIIDMADKKSLCKGFIVDVDDDKERTCIIDFQKYVEELPKDAMFKLINTLLAKIKEENYEKIRISFPQDFLIPYLKIYKFKKCCNGLIWEINDIKENTPMVIPSYIKEMLEIKQICSVAEMYGELSINDDEDCFEGPDSLSQETLDYHLAEALEDLNIVLDDIDYSYLMTYIVINYKY